MGAFGGGYAAAGRERTDTVHLTTANPNEYTPVLNGATTLIISVDQDANILVQPPAPGTNGQELTLFFKSSIANGDAMVSFDIDQWAFLDYADKQLPAVLDQSGLICKCKYIESLSQYAPSGWCLYHVTILRSPQFQTPLYSKYGFTATAGVTGWTANSASIQDDMYLPSGAPAGVLSTGADGNASMLLTPQAFARQNAPYIKFKGTAQAVSVPVGVTATVYVDLLVGGVTSVNRQIFAQATSDGLIIDHSNDGGISWFKPANTFGFPMAVFDALRVKVECIYTGGSGAGAFVQIDGALHTPGDYGTVKTAATSLQMDLRQNYIFIGTTCDAVTPATGYPDIPNRGEKIELYNGGSGSVTIPGTNIYTGVTPGATAVLPSGKSGSLMWDGTNWRFTLYN